MTGTYAEWTDASKRKVRAAFAVGLIAGCAVGGVIGALVVIFSA